MSAILRHLRSVAADGVRTGLALPLGLVRALRGGAGPGGRADWTAGRAVARSVVGLPVDVLAFALFAYAGFNTVRNVGYPLWYLHTDYHDAWGGPIMAGVWTVHALGWAACLYVLARWPMRWILRGQRALDARLARPRPVPERAGTV
ncbi:hypothetical protein [Kitasatospora terrestris]|uniref:Uncharacterized protein n=1 Tax=Kitasatospora terrestris TaxID=258051 RepID=A0ABP9DAT2_9ACTN